MIQISGGHFQDAGGNVIASGTLVLQLTQDAEVSSIPGQVVAGIPIKIPLSASGSIAIATSIWSNAELSPAGTGYYAQVYNAAGVPVWSQPQIWVIPAVNTDVGTLVPTSVGVSYPSSVVVSASTAAYSATPVFNLSLGNIQIITLTGNVTSSTLTGPSSPCIVVFKIIQDAVGGRTFVWPANVIGGELLSGTANAVNTQMGLWDGTNLYMIPGSYSA